MKFFWRSKICFFEKKLSQIFILFYSVKLIDHSIGNKVVETSVLELSGISPEFSTNPNFWGCACTLSSYTTEWIARQ